MIFQNINECLVRSWKDLEYSGKKRSSRNGGMTELLNYSFELRDPTQCITTLPGRNFNLEYAIAEFLWFMSGSRDGLVLKNWAPGYDQYLEPDGTAHWAYGHRVKNGDNWLVRIKKLLQESPDTRRAVVNVWDNADINHSIYKDKVDVPCLTSLHFLVRENRLSLKINQRSQDVWVGMPYDVFCYCALIIAMAGELNLRVGELHYNATSFHLYEKHADKVSKVLQQDANSTVATRFIPCSIGNDNLTELTALGLILPSLAKNTERLDTLKGPMANWMQLVLLGEML